MSDGDDAVEFLFVEDVGDVLGHEVVQVRGGVGRLVGAAVPEEVWHEDTIALALEAGGDWFQRRFSERGSWRE